MQQLQSTIRKKKLGLDKEKEKTNNIEMGSRALLKKKQLLQNLLPRDRKKEPEGHMKLVEKKNKENIKK